MLNDPAMAPIGKNVLTLTNVEQSDNFTCVAVSKLGNIEATTLVDVQALPPPPRNFQVSSVTSDTVTLTWQAPTLNEPAREYVVKYRQKYSDSNAVKKFRVDPSLTSATIDSLEPFQLYEFTIVTVGEFGEGPTSITKEAQTAPAVPGSPPLKNVMRTLEWDNMGVKIGGRKLHHLRFADDIVLITSNISQAERMLTDFDKACGKIGSELLQVQARSLSRDSVLIKWSPSEKPNGIITNYRIFYTNKDRSTPISLWNIHDTKSDELMATLYGLEPEKRYFIVVQAFNVKGAGELSAVATVTTEHGMPGQPVSVTAKALDSRRVQLTWEKPLFSLPVTGYVVWFNDTGGEKEYTLTSPHEKHIVMALTPDTTYAFRLPTKYPKFDTANCMSEFGGLEKKPEYSGRKEYLLLITNAFYYNICTTTHNTYSYFPNFRVAAISARGQGEFSDPVMVTTMQSSKSLLDFCQVCCTSRECCVCEPSWPSAPPGPPELLSVTAISSSSLHVVWTAPNTSQEIVQYRVRFRVVNTENEVLTGISTSYEDDEAPATKSPVWNCVFADVSDVMANITNLMPFTTYEISVAALTEQGFGPESSHLRVRTHEDGVFFDNIFCISHFFQFQMTTKIPYPVSSRCVALL
uniref:Protein-tyrosine-phosphatase n=1 Tax=Angiostrongylus cantonensis TaxID=6313 RepID=A0A0K0CVT1_ANGCA